MLIVFCLNLKITSAADAPTSLPIAVYTTYPNGGENLSIDGKTVGNVAVIKWQANATSTVTVAIYLFDWSGHRYKIAEGVPNLGIFEWKQNNPVNSNIVAGKQYKIDIVSDIPQGSPYLGLSDSSDTFFTISDVRPPTITVDKKTVNSGESVKLKFTWPSNATSEQITLNCPMDIFISPKQEICSLPINITSNTDYTFVVQNTSPHNEKRDVVVVYIVKTPTGEVRASQTITVLPVVRPTATITVNKHGQPTNKVHDITISAGEILDFYWSGTGAKNYTSTYQSNNAACGSQLPIAWRAFTAQGSILNVPYGSQYIGCAWAVTYYADGVSDTVVVRVAKPVVTTTTVVPIQISPMASVFQAIQNFFSAISGWFK